MHAPTYRVVNVLNTIASSDGNFTMADLARKTQIPVGTLFPIVKTLVDEQFITCDNATGKYRIGIRLYLNGISFLRSGDSYIAVREQLQKLTDETGEATHFCKLSGGNVLYLIKIDSPQPIRMFSAIGKQLGAYGTGVGKALLCEHSLQQLRGLYGDGLKAMTPYTITDFKKLYQQLLEIRKTGFAFECEESNEGIRCIAKPVFKNGRVCAAVSVGIPVFRYTEKKAENIKMLLSETVKKIEKIVVSLDYV